MITSSMIETDCCESSAALKSTEARYCQPYECKRYVSRITGSRCYLFECTPLSSTPIKPDNNDCRDPAEKYLLDLVSIYFS